MRHRVRGPRSHLVMEQASSAPPTCSGSRAASARASALPVASALSRRPTSRFRAPRARFARRGRSCLSRARTAPTRTRPASPRPNSACSALRGAIAPRVPSSRCRAQRDSSAASAARQAPHAKVRDRATPIRCPRRPLMEFKSLCTPLTSPPHALACSRLVLRRLLLPSRLDAAQLHRMPRRDVQCIRGRHRRTRLVHRVSRGLLLPSRHCYARLLSLGDSLARLRSRRRCYHRLHLPGRPTLGRLSALQLGHVSTKTPTAFSPASLLGRVVPQ